MKVTTTCKRHKGNMEKISNKLTVEKITDEYSSLEELMTITNATMKENQTVVMTDKATALAKIEDT